MSITFTTIKAFFYSGVLISGLGAIMDTSIIMATSINELIEKDPQIDTKALKSQHGKSRKTSPAPS